MAFDYLAHFKDWWLANRPFNVPNETMLSHIAETHGVVLYREKPYQVELFNVKPNSEIAAHMHPNVDSFEVYICGDIEFMCDGVWYKQNGLGDDIRILPSSWHGGKFGERGGCFLSIQKWENDMDPKFVGDDWIGQDNSTSYEDSRNKD